MVDREIVNYSPNFVKIKRAASRAFNDRYTWVPTASALALHVTDLDKSISNWAAEQNPVYGSQSSAVDISNFLRRMSLYSFAGSVAVISADSPWEQTLGNKLSGLSMEFGALSSMGLATGFLKDKVGRERPNHGSFTSFPSAHSSLVFSLTALSKRNFHKLSLSGSTHRAFDVALTGMAVGTAWARVEANVHYATDVLIGAALGNFFTRFFYYAFYDNQRKFKADIIIEPFDRGVGLGVQMPY